jgi:hypothetical protein
MQKLYFHIMAFETEILLNEYIRAELISNFSYFSLLQPIYDVLIFNLLRRDVQAVPHTHSCNIRKPWCRRCPKCAYVWLNYMAYLPVALVNAIFKTNLFNLEENRESFRQMLGLAKHTPFECIGQIPETLQQILFQVVSMITTTGYSTADYERWGITSQLTLFLLMFFGVLFMSAIGLDFESSFGSVVATDKWNHNFGGAHFPQIGNRI